jgi:hypothetical protein
MPPVETEQKTAQAAQPETGSQALQPAAAAQPPAPAPKAGVPVRMGLAPTSLEEAWRMSQFMSSSELVPKQYRNKAADVLVAIQYGMELGFMPMQALQSIAVINGRPGIYGDGFLALILSSPLCLGHDEYYEVGGERRDSLTLEELKRDDSTAVCTFVRRGRPHPVTRRFSVGQAKKASLLGKEGPWSNYPDRMLMMRARGFAGRDAFADLLRGVKTAEELVDLPADDTIDVPRTEPIQPRRASEARSSSSAPAPSTPATAPTPDPATAASSPASTSAESDQPVAQPRETRGLYVKNTLFVRPKVGEPYYEISTQAVTGNIFNFVTRDEQLYKEAQSFEGTDHLIAIAWKGGKSSDQKIVSIAERIAIDETTSAARPAAESADPGLFN